jgi:enoyl-CoA hydratase/carnithine racemase
MIDFTRRGRVAIATIAHGKANAFDLELCDDLARMLAQFRASPSAALVVTAHGTIFSAGVDLVRVVDGGASYVQRFLPALSATFDALFTCPKPIVAAVNGHAIAGGCILACAADHRVMARGSGRIGIPELRVGVPFPSVPLEIVRFAAPHHAQALVYGGATFSPDEAVDQGIVDAAVAPADLIDTTVAAAEQLASLPPAVFEMTKRQVRAPAVERIRAAGTYDRDVIAMWASSDTLAHIRDYIARTFKKPVT